MSKHTQGPWIVRDSYNATVGTESQLTAVAYGDDPDCKPDERMKANARLIAAAPELLDALKAMLEQFNYNTITGLVHDESAAITLARRAVEKAEGAAQ